MIIVGDKNGGIYGHFKLASGKIKKPETACSVRLCLIKYPYGVLP